MNDDELELASTYLDGAATAAEAARVESDPALRAAVAELRAARQALAAVAPADDETRERAIAAALDVFDAASSSAASAAAPSPAAGVVALKPRRRWTWGHGLGAAAAAAVVVVAGIAVFRQDVEAPTADEARLETAGATVPVTSTLTPAPTIAAIPTVAPAPALASAPAVSPAEPAVAAMADAEAAIPPDPASTTDAEDPDVVLRSPADLAAYVESRPEPPPELAAARTACALPASAPREGAAESAAEGAAGIVADAVYVAPDGSTHEIVVVSLSGGRHGGLDVTTCTVVLRTPP